MTQERLPFPPWFLEAAILVLISIAFPACLIVNGRIYGIIPLPGATMETKSTQAEAQRIPFLGRSQAEVTTDYLTNYVGSHVDDPLWNGSVRTCEAGNVPDSVHRRVIQRLNFFRRMAGLADDATLDLQANEESQACSLISEASQDLDHTPSPLASCFSLKGRSGCSKSNIHLGLNSTGALTSLMRDDGEKNAAVGHRRWMLLPWAKTFGHGSTAGAMSLFVFGPPVQRATEPTFVAWPPPGYVPLPLVFQRWSLSIGGADFSRARVEMRDEAGNEIRVETEKVIDGFGLNTIVWKPINLQHSAGKSYTIRVSAVETIPEVTYTVKPFAIATSAVDNYLFEPETEVIEWTSPKQDLVFKVRIQFRCLREEQRKCRDAIQATREDLRAKIRNSLDSEASDLSSTDFQKLYPRFRDEIRVILHERMRDIPDLRIGARIKDLEWSRK
jgi:hypothetical protein